MKSFVWKILVCVIPCVLAAVVTTFATVRYYEGDPGGFKFGVDLVGGTILVYEIDVRKSQDSEGKFGDPGRDINILAESLKKRIDPNDLYNITIRPAGGEGRIEIILPTGGTHRTKKAEATWNNLLKQMRGEFVKDYTGELAVGRGKLLELADQIQLIQSTSNWKSKLFASEEGWGRLKDSARKYWAKIDNDIKGEKDPKDNTKYREGRAPNKKLKDDLDAIKHNDPDRFDKFSDFLITTLANSDSATTPKTIKNWYKKQAWDETMTRVRARWKFLSPFQEDMERINPDSVEQLTTFVLSRGTVVGQAGLALLEPLVGDNLEKVFDTNEDPTAKQVREFITELYGRPIQDITKAINKYMEENQLSKDVSVEHVQQIKDMVSKVGALEFRILANNFDDIAVIGAKEDEGDARKLIKSGAKNTDSAVARELEDAQQKGLPTPAPRELGSGKPKPYVLTLANGVQS
ncbi:MAG: hypothetical protein HY289_15245, partial [Planctomycetes bacterium]|nr:hypothetical protein [Planctomycetota bacterium]